MYILGIDPGTAIVGWGILELEGTRFTPRAYGHISTPATMPLPARIAEISRDLGEICKKYQPEEAAVEELFFFRNRTTIIPVAEARGAILLTLELLNITIAEYTPLQVKQSLTGYGRAEKKQVQLMIKNLLHLETLPKPDDVADALALALCHAHSRKMQNLLRN